MKKIVTLLLASLILVACGQKGPLVPPEPANLSAAQATGTN